MSITRDLLKVIKAQSNAIVELIQQNQSQYDASRALSAAQARIEELEQRLAENIAKRDNIHSHRIKLTHMFSAAKHAHIEAERHAADRDAKETDE